MRGERSSHRLSLAVEPPPTTKTLESERLNTVWAAQREQNSQFFANGRSGARARPTHEKRDKSDSGGRGAQEGDNGVPRGERWPPGVTAVRLLLCSRR